MGDDIPSTVSMWLNSTSGDWWEAPEAQELFTSSTRDYASFHCADGWPLRAWLRSMYGNPYLVGASELYCGSMEFCEASQAGWELLLEAIGARLAIRESEPNFGHAAHENVPDVPEEG